MRVHLKGIHRIERRLATGETRIYYYAWRGGPRIDAQPGTPEFIHSYQEAHASLRRPKAGTLIDRRVQGIGGIPSPRPIEPSRLFELHQAD